MRIVITGASGNVGTVLVDRLLGGGHDVAGVVRRPPDTQHARQMRWYEADLTQPQSTRVLEQAFEKADAVVHLAWGFQPSHRPHVLESLGVGGTQRVLLATEAAGVPHLVHMSSVGVYSPRSNGVPVDENYPREGVPTSPYSQHKAAAERLLDGFEKHHPEVRIARMRPGIIGQRNAGSALLRYGLPGLVPASALRFVPVLPLDPSVAIPMVHAVDVAQAIATAVEAQIPGAYNLAADPVVTASDITEVLRARLLPVSATTLRAVVAAGWHTRLLQLDPGWIDLALNVPVLDTSRARSELSWLPTRTGVEVLEEMVAGMSEAAHGDTPVLRPRTVAGQLAGALRHGPVSYRRRT